MNDSQANEQDKHSLIENPTKQHNLYVGFMIVSILMVIAAAVSGKITPAAGLAFVAAAVSITNGMMLVKALRVLQLNMSSATEGKNAQD